MVSENRKSLSLVRPAKYEIIVPGHLDESWSDWAENLVVTIEYKGDDPITILTCTFDQAGLQGLLSRLYSLGVPLLSVICVAND